jgi:transcriptional regulator with XRE-family HTH domain
MILAVRLLLFGKRISKMPNRYTSLGEIVRDLRQSKKLTQKDLASACGVYWLHISKIERGACRQIGVKTLMRLTRVLGMELLERLYESELY